MKHPIRAGLAALTALGLAVSAQATVIGGEVTGGAAKTQGGTFIKLGVPFTESTPGNTVGNNTFQTPNLYAFDEDQNIDLVDPLDYDLTVGGSYGGGVPLNPGTLAPGQTVASHYVFFDPGPSTTIEGYVEFDSDIVGVYIFTDSLFATDFLANTGVTYLNPGARGLEGPSADKIVTVSDRRIDISFRASTPGDYIRVLTQFSPGAEVPEPLTGALVGAGLLGIAGLRRRRV